tara:strand:+ start:2121 stop:4442 length:2322 start_codon:yes stop_codon:yes gene_type:complete
MRKVQLYINNQLVDLFDDEKIEITSSIQNIQDISKVYTDFSQSFTVPCSDNNNAIFDFFYNNDVANSTFIAKERADARIEINHSPFRKGQVQLEGSEIKNNQADSYKITFFGDVVTLKDLFGDAKLSDLDYTDIAFNYSGSNVNDRIQNTADLDVRFPLISSNRVWVYGGGGSNDISNASYPIVFSELFPAIKDKAIIDLIKDKYTVNFTSQFLDSSYFNKSFTWWKNKAEDLSVVSEALPLLFNDTASGSNLTNNQAVINYIPITGNTSYSFQNVIVTITSTTPNVSYYIDVYLNGTLLNTIEGTTSGSHNVANLPNNPTLSNQVYTFKIRSIGGASTIVGEVKSTFSYWTANVGSGPTQTNSSFTESFTNVVTTSNFDFNNTAPDITIADWFSGILKQFNLTCYPQEADKYYVVEPLEEWYNFGGEVDITPYTDIKSIKVDRPKLYKAISFEYEKSKAFLNEEFEGRNGRDYGNLNLTMEYDGKDFKVKLPFENMLFTKFTSTDLQVSYALDNAVGGKSYIPKPVKLFMDEAKTVSFRFNDGSSTFEVTTYMPFGQDQVYNTENYSQNFGFDMSTLKDIPINNSLYRNWYESYIQNLFNDKFRQVTVKCRLPLPILTLLTLDDSIILRDKLYRIDSMKTDLTTGEVNLVLLSDFTDTKGAIINAPINKMSGENNSVILPVKLLKSPTPNSQFGGGAKVTLDATEETQFVTVASGGVTRTLPITFTANTDVTISTGRNVSGSDRVQAIPISYKDASGTVFNTSNIIIVQESL